MAMKKFPKVLYVYYDPEVGNIHLATEDLSGVVAIGEPLPVGVYMLSERRVAVAAVELLKDQAPKKKRKK